VDLAEADGAAEIEGVLEGGVGFAWEADETIGGEGQRGEGAPEFLDTLEEPVGGVAAVHEGEDAVVATLEGYVEMGTEGSVGEEFEEGIGDFEQLDGTEAETQEAFE